MKKVKFLAAMVALTLTVAMIISLGAVPVLAKEPQWIFECPKLVIPVEINGDGQGWEDAGIIIVNNDNPVFQEFGIWQGNAEAPIPTSELSVEYRLKWDDKYFYILEKRFDKNHVVFDDIDDEPANGFPWMHSGTLFFLNYDSNFADPTRDGCYEIFWVNNGSKLVMTGRNVNKAQMFPEDSEMEGILIAGSKDGNTYITEVAVPWATMRTVSGFPAPSEGLKLRMTPVVSAFHAVTDDTADRFQGHIWNQLNFYTDTSFGYQPDDPITNGGMILTGATYTPPQPAVEEPEVPAAVEIPAPVASVVTAPAVVVTPVPQTSDSVVYIVVLCVLALAGIITAVNKSKKKI